MLKKYFFIIYLITLFFDIQSRSIKTYLTNLDKEHANFHNLPVIPLGFGKFILKLDNQNIDSLEGLEQILADERIVGIDLTDNNIKDLDYLNDIDPDLLNKLEYLKLTNNQISDVEPLTKCANLQFLCLKKNKILDIAPLRECRNLKNLNLSGNILDKIDGVCSLPNLEFLDISYNRISDLRMIKNLEKLKNLDFEGNSILYLPNFDELPNLSGHQKTFYRVIFDTIKNKLSFLQAVKEREDALERSNLADRSNVRPLLKELDKKGYFGQVFRDTSSNPSEKFKLEKKHWRNFCVSCREKIEDKSLYNLPCGHSAHADCIFKTRINNKIYCPLCKKEYIFEAKSDGIYLGTEKKNE